LSEKAKPGRGLWLWYTTGGVWVKASCDSTGKLTITSTDLTTILSEVQSATYGLEAIKDAVDLIPVTAMRGTDNAALASSLTTHDTDIKADFDRHLTRLDFWSITEDNIAITATADQDYNLPDVTVPTLPTGFTIYKVYLLFKCAIIRDSSGSDNAIDEAGVIRIKKDGDATFDGNGLDAYIISDNMWAVDVTNVGRDRGGDGFQSNVDISSKVDGADTYNIRLDSISADGSNLNLVDVAVGLRVIVY